MPLSVNARSYFLACDFLWSALGLYEYLADIIVTDELLDSLQMCWGKQLGELGRFALDEGMYSLRIEKATREEGEVLYSEAYKRADQFMANWASTLRSGSLAAHQEYPLLNQTTWLYYYYCSFLLRVLKEYEQLVRGLESIDAYYRRYQENIEVFDNLRNALQKEQPLGDKPNHERPYNANKQLADMDAIATRLGGEWREAVYSAANPPN